jgi:putative DNA methylase
MAVVAEGERQRVYLNAQPEMEVIARSASPIWKPELKVPTPCHDVDRLPMYGMQTWGDAFTPRQLVALTTFSDLIDEAREQVKQEALASGMFQETKDLNIGGKGATVYADAVGVYLVCALDKSTDYCSTFCSWISGGQTMRNTFSRQAIPMVWDYAESNIFSESTGSYSSSILQVVRVMGTLPASIIGLSLREDAQNQTISTNKIISTDPPYYDNIDYSDLSDFFYVWLRRSQKAVFPEIFATLAVPKTEELVALPHRQGSKQKAEVFFLDGMTQAMNKIADQAHSAFPITIYYAFKQSEIEVDESTISTGWETFLDAVIQAGLAISGTWPIRTELTSKVSGIGRNMLASSIILVCRERMTDAPTTTRREFVAILKAELPMALAHLQISNIAPVDLAQAAIGPGMSVYTRFARVLESDGSLLSVRTVLALINEVLDEVLTEQEGDFDAYSRWALAWFDQSGFTEGEYGVAETLSKAKNTTVDGMVKAGILTSHAGKVRLLRPDELSADWDPSTNPRFTTWEVVHHLIRSLEEGGESAAAKLVAILGSKSEVARQLSYRLYTICEHKKRAQEAFSYNGLVQSWPEITRLAHELEQLQETKRNLFN